MSKLAYWRRVLAAYLLPGKSQLSFWHETPKVNPRMRTESLGDYYMSFAEKARYSGPFDEKGIPVLDYRGSLGRQYNPIAIAQYGLANLNAYGDSGESGALEKALQVADWLVEHLEPNAHGLPMWMHHFDFEYRTRLQSPWYSGLAQGQGISMLVRAAMYRNPDKYIDVAKDAFRAFLHPVDKGGVVVRDENDQTWLEEYLVSPPTHILNGFMWASWGLYDLHLACGNAEAKQLWDECVLTLRSTLESYDCGYWSLYEQSGIRMKMLASPFYHALHIVQLRIMHRLTGEPEFSKYADRWEGYARGRINRARALAHKSVFKICYY